MTTETRVTIQPRANAGGRGLYLPAVDVTDRLLRIDSIKAGVDRDDYEWGVATIGNCKMSLYNDDGYLDDDGVHPEAVFPEGRDLARVELRIGDNVLFSGDLTESETVQHTNNGKIDLLVSSFNDVMRRTTVPGNTAQAGEDLRTTVIKLSQTTPGLTGFGTVDLSRSPVATLEDAAPLNFTTAWDAVKTISEGAGVTFLVGGDGTISVVPADQPVGDDELPLDNPIKVSIKNGATRIRNAITVEYGAGGDENKVTQTHQRSVEQYRARPLPVRLPWVTSQATATRIAASLVTQNALPQRICQVQSFIRPEDVGGLGLLRRARVTVQEEYHSQSPVTAGGYKVQVREVGLDFLGRILRYRITPQPKGLLADITLEEIT